MIQPPVPAKINNKATDLHTTLMRVCQCRFFQVYFALPFRPMGERATSNVITIVAPPKAQHPQPLRLKNYWRRQIWRELDQPTTEGARNASCNLSGTKDRWAQHETVLRLFHF
jgi:hypothetical protein